MRVTVRELRLVVWRALERASLVEAGSAGLLATMAFLVVFSVLIRDFFWIVMLVSLAEFLSYCGCAALLRAHLMPNPVAPMEPLLCLSKRRTSTPYEVGTAARAQDEKLTSVKN